MKKELFALLYASISDESEIYVTSFGVFNTEEEARKEMQEYIEEDIQDGYNKVDWEVSSDTAVYDDSAGLTHKTYRIQRLPNCK